MPETRITMSWLKEVVWLIMIAIGGVVSVETIKSAQRESEARFTAKIDSLSSSVEDIKQEQATIRKDLPNSAVIDLRFQSIDMRLKEVWDEIRLNSLRDQQLKDKLLGAGVVK